MTNMSGIKKILENDGRIRYEVQGTDGWKLVTHDELTAIRESKSPKAYGSVRVNYSSFR